VRNPLFTALEWATLDVLSRGRTIFGPCMGNPEEGVRREFAALGLPFRDRATIFEEGLQVLNDLWRTGSTSFKGTYFNYDDVSFHSGTEMAPLNPLQQPPPIWIVSNPRLLGDQPTDKMRAIMERACRRIIEYGDGWMTCCRATRPEELTEQIGYLTDAAAELERDWSDYTVSYQVTMNIGDSEEEARTAFDDYISKYYPELSQAMDLSNWGPVGTPEQIAEWIRTFAEAGVDHFICRFGAIDQFAQVERFAQEVLPQFSAERVR
jgi:alkanesulfonate monooxygenase SsuD/methylene tetrahydromethanopterin reductase-like flavin-dependent oxidoreductase (luciferase family)